MRILCLTHAFNSLCQRLFVELTRRGHQVSIEYDVNDAVSSVRCRRQIVAIAEHEHSANRRLFPQRFADKKRQRQEEERRKPLEAYRQVEMARMKLNYYGFDPSCHVARYNFVHNCPTPGHRSILPCIAVWTGPLNRRPPAARSNQLRRFHCRGIYL